MGGIVDGLVIVFGDNLSVVNGELIPEFSLSKKHLEICYYTVREASAAGICKVGYVKGNHNISNCLPNIFSGIAMYKVVNQWMWFM